MKIVNIGCHSYVQENVSVKFCYLYYNTMFWSFKLPALPTPPFFLHFRCNAYNYCPFFLRLMLSISRDWRSDLFILMIIFLYYYQLTIQNQPYVSNDTKKLKTKCVVFYNNNDNQWLIYRYSTENDLLFLWPFISMLFL